MRIHDREILEEPRSYPDAVAAERDLEQRLHVHAPALWELEAEMLSDLDLERYGIGWWAPYPDDKRRILISDHLIHAVQAIRVNLVEAALHHLEFVDCSDHIATLMARPEWPKQRSPADLLPERSATMHACGFFRAVGSALDCLAGAVIGVLAVPQSILTADLGGLRSWFRAERAKTQIRLPSHSSFATELEGIVAAAGPHGWAEWVLAYRNMLVHRGRRTELNLLTLEARILDAQGRPIPRRVPHLLLAKDPHLSDVEAQLVSAIHVIREDALKLIPAALESALFVVRRVADLLVVHWSERRSGRPSIPQPREQWLDLARATLVFDGYDAEKVAMSPDFMMGSPSNVRRFRAACLGTDRRELWSTRLTGQ